MATHKQKLEWWGDRICGQGRIDTSFFNRYPVRIQREAQAAVKALEDRLLLSGYVPTPGSPIGSYSCRKISGTDTWSLHAVPIALDIEYDLNPHLHEPIERGFGTDPRFKLTEANIVEAEDIRNTHGEPVWKWLGWTIGDTMHFEIDVPPDRLEIAPMDTTTYRTVINVPATNGEPKAWAASAIDWAIDVGLLVIDDAHQDDWENNLADGRFWVMMQRYDNYLRSR